MARLSHPSVIAVHDVGTYGKQLFIAMEFVRGGTLRRWTSDRPRRWREVLDVYLQAARGLAGAHAAGLVHRDFKPDNVLVGEDGRVRITDFGLARARSQDSASSEVLSPPHDVLDATITRTGAVVGTPAYMAPEQLGGAPADVRADMFSFCVALHEALYGERPFEGRTLPELRAAALAGRVRSAPPDSQVPPGLRRALLVGLRANPNDRYGSMTELIRALEDASRVRRPGPFAVGLALSILAVLAGAVGLHADRSADVQRPGAPVSRGVAIAGAAMRTDDPPGPPDESPPAALARASPAMPSRSSTPAESGSGTEPASRPPSLPARVRPARAATGTLPGRPGPSVPPQPTSPEVGSRPANAVSAANERPDAGPPQVKVGHNEAPILW
jgi:serine/threonine protein kinase